jgi:hypothetical protein
MMSRQHSAQPPMRYGLYLRHTRNLNTCRRAHAHTTSHTNRTLSSRQGAKLVSGRTGAGSVGLVLGSSRPMPACSSSSRVIDDDTVMLTSVHTGRASASAAVSISSDTEI